VHDILRYVTRSREKEGEKEEKYVSAAQFYRIGRQLDRLKLAAQLSSRASAKIRQSIIKEK
jgi:hypothetical protein